MNSDFAGFKITNKHKRFLIIRIKYNMHLTQNTSARCNIAQILLQNISELLLASFYYSTCQIKKGGVKYFRSIYRSE